MGQKINTDEDDYDAAVKYISEVIRPTAFRFMNEHNLNAGTMGQALINDVILNLMALGYDPDDLLENVQYMVKLAKEEMAAMGIQPSLEAKISKHSLVTKGH